MAMIANPAIMEDTCKMKSNNFLHLEPDCSPGDMNSGKIDTIEM